MKPITKALSDIASNAYIAKNMEAINVMNAAVSLCIMMFNASIDVMFPSSMAFFRAGINTDDMSSAKIAPKIKLIIKRTSKSKNIFLFSLKASLISFLMSIS